jgi:hypothetical protein
MKLRARQMCGARIDCAIACGVCACDKRNAQTLRPLIYIGRPLKFAVDGWRGSPPQQKREFDLPTGEKAR